MREGQITQRDRTRDPVSGEARRQVAVTQTLKGSDRQRETQRERYTDRHTSTTEHNRVTSSHRQQWLRETVLYTHIHLSLLCFALKSTHSPHSQHLNTRYAE